MNMKLKTLILCLACGLATSLRAAEATDTPVTNKLSSLKAAEQFAVSFFKDNTNFFGQKTVIIGIDGAYGRGHSTDDQTAKDHNEFGAVLTVGFPIDDQGQVQIGLWGAYFDRQIVYGSFQTTLGTTFTVPSWVPLVHGEQAFIFNEGGPGYRFGQGQGSLFAQDFVGAVWKHQFGGGWVLFVNGAYGKVSILTGQEYLFGLKVGKSF